MWSIIKFCFNGIPWSTSSVRGTVFAFRVWVTTLDHKTRNHPVENGAIIKPFFGQVFKVFNMPRCFILQKFQLNISKRCLNNSNFTSECRGSSDQNHHQACDDSFNKKVHEISRIKLAIIYEYFK